MIFSVCFQFILNAHTGNWLCQLCIKHECKQTNPWGSNWKVFADLIELCLLSICLILVYSLLLRCCGSNLELSSPPFFSVLQLKNTGDNIEEMWPQKSISFFLVSKETELWISWKHAVWAALCFCPFQALIWDPWSLVCTRPCFPCHLHEILE